MNSPEFVLSLPGWVAVLLTDRDPHYADMNERMQLVVELAHLNVQHQTGGPFAAAIFEKQSGRLLSVGINMVEKSNCSAAHAEIVAIALGQKILGTYDLGSQKPAEYELVTSCEPCAMCLGAICWSGVRQVVCGARDEDARRIGFDEGDKPSDWVATLQKRGIAVKRDVLREKARQVLQQYVDEGGLIYNPGRTNRK
jgi:tRNA(Arg) A34 adenosine deaminase TadA